MATGDYACTILEESPEDDSILVEFSLNDYAWGGLLDSWMAAGVWGHEDMKWLLEKVMYPSGENLPFNVLLSYRVLIPVSEIHSIVDLTTGRETILNRIV
jgi:hypothetical protein